MHDNLGGLNMLSLRHTKGPFAYPFLVEDGMELRKKLIQYKVYVPLLWPNVLEKVVKGSTDYRLAADLLPLPCDQRYGEDDMARICNLIKSIRKEM